MLPVLLLLATLPTGCSGCSGWREPPEGKRQAAGEEDALLLPFARAAQGPAPSARVEQPDATRYPTIMPLSYEEFPPDPGPAPAVAGRTLRVVAGGKGGAGTFASIAEALKQARDGDKVLVEPGTYAEGLDGDCAALTLGDGITLQGVQRPGGRPLVRPRTRDHTYGLVIAGDHVKVIGIDLEGFVRANVLLGDAHGQKDVVLRDMHIRAPADGEWHDGIVSTADNTRGGPPVLTGLRIQGVTVQGASLSISCNSGPCRSWRLHDVVVRAASGVSSGADGIAIENGENFLFTAVQVSGATADGIDVKGRRVTIYDSVVSRVARNGIKLWYEGDVVNTMVTNTGADAALVMSGGPGSKLRILHSLVAFHNFHGPRSYHMAIGYPDEPARLEIINSLFFDSSGGAYIAPGSQITIRGSLWSGIENGEALIVFSGGTGRKRLIRMGHPASVFSELGLGEDNLAPGTDPQIDDGEKGTFLPLPGSPLIDAGVLQGVGAYPQLDALGKPRVQGKAPDIGPFEVR